MDQTPHCPECNKSNLPSGIQPVNRVTRHDRGRTDDGNFRIEMKTPGRPVKFGGMLSEEQQLWLIALLKRTLLSDGPVHFAGLPSPVHR